MLRFIPLLSACAALAVAGCGDDDNDDGGGGSSGGGGGYGAAPAKTEPAKVGGTAVRMKDIAFDPETIEVKVGDKVTWTNDDQVAHNVVGDGFESETLDNGGSYSYTVAEPGTISYECTLHSGMEGTIEASR